MSTARVLPTEGPWEPNRNGFAVYTRDHRLIATVGIGEEDRANLQLISHAPAMLEVLRDFREDARALLLSEDFSHRGGRSLYSRVLDILEQIEGSSVLLEQEVRR